MLLYVVCTAGEFVWNEGGVVQLPAPYVMLGDFQAAQTVGLAASPVTDSVCVSASHAH